MSDRFYAFPHGRNRGFRKGKAALPRVLHIDKEQTCEVEPMSVVATVPASVVSPAISLAISPVNGREQLTTEAVGNKPSNQSGGHPEPLKPNCYQCKHRRDLSWSAHSECGHPALDEMTKMLAVVGLVNPLGVSGAKHGIQSGWFMWPLDFDPVWLNSCNGFDAIGGLSSDPSGKGE